MDDDLEKIFANEWGTAWQNEVSEVEKPKEFQF